MRPTVAYLHQHDGTVGPLPAPLPWPAPDRRARARKCNATSPVLESVDRIARAEARPRRRRATPSRPPCTMPHGLRRASVTSSSTTPAVRRQRRGRRAIRRAAATHRRAAAPACAPVAPIAAARLPGTSTADVKTVGDDCFTGPGIGTRTSVTIAARPRSTVLRSRNGPRAANRRDRQRQVGRDDPTVGQRGETGAEPADVVAHREQRAGAQATAGAGDRGAATSPRR